MRQNTNLICTALLLYIFTHIEHPQYVMQEEVILDECADKLCTRQSVSRSLSRVPEPLFDHKQTLGRVLSFKMKECTVGP